jgi:WD40 repeat protein
MGFYWSKAIALHRLHRLPSSYNISPDGRYMVAVSKNNPYNIRFWETATTRENVLNMRSNLSYCELSSSRDGRRLALADNGLITLLDVGMAMNNSKDHLSGAHRSDIDLLFFSDDGKLQPYQMLTKIIRLFVYGISRLDSCSGPFASFAFQEGLPKWRLLQTVGAS